MICNDLATDKIKSFLDFKAGWHYGEGESFSEDMVDLSIRVVNLLKNKEFHTIDAFPTFDGEILVSSYFDNMVFDFTIHKNKTITLGVEMGDKEINCFELTSFDEIEITMRCLKK